MSGKRTALSLATAKTHQEAPKQLRRFIVDGRYVENNLDNGDDTNRQRHKLTGRFETGTAFDEIIAKHKLDSKDRNSERG